MDTRYSVRLLQALKILDHLLNQAIAAMQMAQGTDAPDPYRGLYISQEEVEALLSREPGGLRLQPDNAKLEVAWLDQDDTTSPLRWLQQTFELSNFDVGLVVIAIAPEVDQRYERLYAYLQDDVTRKRPTLDLALNLLCTSIAEKLARRVHLTTDAALIQHGLVQLLADPNQVHPPLLSHYLKLDDQVIRLLLNLRGLDARLTSSCRLIKPQRSLEDLPQTFSSGEALKTLCVDARKHHHPLRLYFQGLQGVGKQLTAEALAKELGMQLLVVELVHALKEEDGSSTLKLIFREAQFQNALLYLRGLDTLRTSDRPIPYQCLISELVADSGITILAGEQPWNPPPIAFGQPLTEVMVVSFPMPDFGQRQTCWQTHLTSAGIQLSDPELENLTGSFRLTPGQIAETIATACHYARWRGVTTSSDAREDLVGAPTIQDLFTAARAQSNQKLSQVAQKLQPKYTWNDLVLPPDPLTQLREIINSVKHRHIVYDDWGFNQKLSSGKGLNALFAGSSGTGKTMSAEVIANELALDIYKIDLSQIVSKYIGETEKNLDRVFREAQTSNAIIFFDEADALFGKRSEVKDAHDRYANIETGYLLQKMEEYEGVALLATNLRANLDEAFARRFHFVVEFPFPDEEYRYSIWQGIFPAQTPLAEDVDIRNLARSLKLSGGNIKNIALAAAFLAVDEGQPIGMSHLMRAAKREFQKVGRAWEEARG